MMIMRRTAAVLLVFLLYVTGELLSAAPYSFRRIEVEDGLSQNMVYCIWQDRDGFLWFGTQDGLNRYDGTYLKTFRKSGDSALGNDGICSLVGDESGRLWVGTLDGLFVFEPRSEVFTRVTLGGGHRLSGIVRSIARTSDGDMVASVADTCLIRVNMSLEASLLPFELPDRDTRIRSVYADASGNVWAACWSSGLLRIRPDGSTESFRQESVDMFSKVLPLGPDRLLVGTTDRGVLVFNIRSRKFSPFPLLSGGEIGFVHDIHIASDSRIWVGTEHGLFIRDEEGVSRQTHVPGDSYSLSDNAVFCITEDSLGGMWVGTYFGGVSYCAEYFSQFRKYFPVPGFNALKGKNISEFLEREDGRIYVGTEDAGLHLFDPVTGSFESVGIPSTNVHALSWIGGILHVGTYGGGLFAYDEKSKKCSRVELLSVGGSLRDESVYSILEDLSGNVWVGTEGGLLVRRHGSSSFERVCEDMINSQVNDIHQDIDGAIWVATSVHGVFFRDSRSERWISLPFSPRFVTCILEDGMHDIWIGTEDSGIMRYERSSGRFCNMVTSNEGLPDNMVYKLLEDKGGNIWGSTNHGLFRFSPVDGQVTVFDHNAGLGGDQFNYKSGLCTSDGVFYFGGVKGFVGFSPDALVYPRGGASLVFTRFLLDGREVDYGGPDSPIDCAVTYSDRIVLHPGQKIFSIGFSDLNFPASKVRRYRYRLVGLDDAWIEASPSSLITISDLKPGSYRLELTALPIPGEDSELSLISMPVKVMPPWYRSIWAFVCYAISLLLVAAFCIRRYSLGVRRRNAAVIEEMEHRKEKELYDSKIGFFTQITHEIRTPLTLITSPVTEIMQHTDKDSPIYEDLSIVKRNCDRLLSLVNELLDFRNVSEEAALPNFVHADMVSLTSSVLSDFNALTASRGLEVRCTLPAGLEADVDRAVYSKILSNIFTNACKHASSIITVELAADNDKFCLRVGNDGKLIPAGEDERIFDPFVKLDENIPGSGIGLPFARTLAATHGGSIFLDRSCTQTCFVVELPMHQEGAFVIGEAEKSHSAETVPVDAEPKDENSPRILIVDDNADFISFLSRKLSSEYDTLTASDGMEAQKILASENIDMVITDLMMPGLDGASLCSFVKGDLRTSHIPVIVVTAKSDERTRVKCTRQGADDFIAKPFSIDYLLVKITNLLHSRENLRRMFNASPEAEASTMASSPKDTEFLDRLTGLIEDNLEDPDFSVDSLADAFNMSRATFYRKMKGVASVSPNEFIKICRLKHAASLLQQKRWSVAEVSYMVGFNSPSYFSRCFVQQFGVSPKEYK